ncbi:hypothetical protein RQP46_000487 [Phenoliferia psychrophenolica]
MDVPAVAGSKRPAPSPSTQSQQSTGSTQSQPRHPPPAKRRKTDVPAAPSLAAVLPTASSDAIPTPPPEASTSTLAPLAAPSKRPRHEGALRRLAHAVPRAAGVTPTATLGGSKIGGKSKDLNTPGSLIEEMWVTRKGLGFGGYLKKGVASFVERGATKLTVHAMGAAIPLALSLAMAIRDAVPGGTPDEDGDGAVKMEVRTGTFDVSDEITPEDDDEDVVYQTRSKSTISVDLTTTTLLSPSVLSSIGTAAYPDIALPAVREAEALVLEVELAELAFWNSEGDEKYKYMMKVHSGEEL